MPDPSTVRMPHAASAIVIQTEAIACPLCDHADHDFVIQSKDPQWGIPGTFRVVGCQSCGHRYMNPAPIASSLSDCYPVEYGPHQNRPANTSLSGEHSVEVGSSKPKNSGRPWYLKWLPLKKVPGLRRFFFWLLDDRSQVFPSSLTAVKNEVVTDAAPLADATDELLRRDGSHQQQVKSNPKAFELGCAAGAYLQKLRNAGWEVQGLEPGVEAANTALQAGLPVDQGTLNDRSYPSDTYQWVALWMVLEHVPNPRAALNELHRMLAPGGTLALSVPNAGCWEPVVFGRHWDAWDLPRHLHHFRPSTIQRLLVECGYTDIKIQHQRTLLNVVGSLGVWLSAAFPSSRVGVWLRNYPHQPRLWFQLLMAPMAQLLGMMGQGGRLTVTATKTSDAAETDSQVHEQSGPVSQRDTDS